MVFGAGHCFYIAFNLYLILLNYDAARENQTLRRRLPPTYISQLPAFTSSCDLFPSHAETLSITCPTRVKPTINVHTDAYKTKERLVIVWSLAL